MRGDLRVASFGLVLGYLLSWIGFTDYDEMQAMFSLSSIRLWLAFGSAVMVAAIGYRFHAGLAPRKIVHPGVVPGSILFGLGWALTCTCPGAALAQLGEGKLPALLTVVGIFLGSGLYSIIHRRFFRWDAGSCGT